MKLIQLWTRQRLLPVLFLLCSSWSLAASTAIAPINGTVTGDEGEPLIGVTVAIKGTTSGTVTDLDGNYTLDVPANAEFLVFSYTGYATQEIAINNRSRIDVVLETDAEVLDEIVVVGYGTVKKSDLTGAVASVKSEELTAYPAIGAEQALQGRAAGVQITSNNGAPGSDFKVRVRGGTSINASSDPIFVVDGFVGASLPPPEDIASIEVLKDASATAIYGSRGANGVIMVTTKRGTAGETKIEFNASHTLQSEINRLDLLNASQFNDYITETNPGFQSLGANTDWQEEILQQGNIQNYQMGISGGANNVRYYLSGAYFDQTGIVKNSNFQRFSVTSNIDLQATEKLKVGLNLFAQRENSDRIPTQSGNRDVIAVGLRFEPDQPIRDADGNYTLARLNDLLDNPVAVLEERTEQQSNDRFRGGLFAEFAFLDNLKLKTTFNASTNSFRNGRYIPSTLIEGAGTNGQARINNTRNNNLLSETYLTFDQDFGASTLTAVAGYSYQRDQRETFAAGNTQFITDAGLFFDLGGGAMPIVPGSGFSEWELVSYVGRLNYSIGDKYLFTFNARYDGTSVFSDGNKWAFFPSGAVAWNLKNESFLVDNDLFSTFKLRASYGETGNRAIGAYSTLARFSSAFVVQDGALVNAVVPTSVSNENLTWETTSQLDIGADVGLYNGRINLTLDYYRMETSDLIFSLPLPEYSGFGSQLSNIGRVENKGFELAIGTRNLVGEFKWNTDFNISFNRNKVLELPGGNDIFYRSGPGHLVGLDNTQILREGESVGTFFGWNYLGVYQQGDDFIPGGSFEQEPGGEKYEDINGDGVLDADDRTIIGNPQPDFIFGLNNEFTYKNFDLNLFFQGSQGNDIFSYTLLELNLGTGLNNGTTALLDRWTPSNTNTDVPAAVGGRARRASNRWIYDGSFIRLKNVALGYTLPQSVVDGIGISRLRVYISAQNILTFTDYPGFDPEVNFATGGNTNGNRNLGLDYASYPNAKGVTFGLNVGF
ncbi:MAG: TonB-dependent receptor [Bacteroidota bacterium]